MDRLGLQQYSDGGCIDPRQRCMRAAYRHTTIIWWFQDIDGGHCYVGLHLYRLSCVMEDQEQLVS